MDAHISRLLLTLGLLASASTAFGNNGQLDYYGYTCERYVDDSATGTGNGLSTGTAWTMTQAMASGNGLIVCIEPGTYTGSDTNDRFAGPFNVPSGSSGDPTIFVAKRAAAYNITDRSEFRNGVTSGDAGSPTISAAGVDHAYWIGPYVNENVSRSTADTGPLVIFDGEDIGIEAAWVDGITVTRIDKDNHNGIRAEQVEDFFLRNNVIRGVKESAGGGSQNSSAIMTYSARSGVIEYNDIDDCDQGIFIKGESGGLEQGNLTVRWNRISDITYPFSGITWGGANTDLSLGPNALYGNLVINAYYGIYLAVYGSSMDPDGPAEVDIHHNTLANIYADEGAIAFQDGSVNSEAMTDVTVRDNVIVIDGAGYGFYLNWSLANNSTIASRGFSINYNALYGFTRWGYLSGNRLTLSDWNTASGYDAGSVTLSGDPFINPPGDNYRLNNTAGAGAPARTGSSTGGYMGYEGSGGTPGLQ